MSEWANTTLGDVCELKRGYDLPKSDRRDGPYPIVSSSGITGFHDEAKVKAPGVVTGRYGTLGAVFLLHEDFWPLNTSLYVRDFKGNEPGFVAALLESMDLAQNDGAAAVPGLNRNQLHQIPIRCPDPDTQRRISNILEAIGDLIENNRRRIEVLEEMAQAIYREWFVHFRFPGHENTTLVDSPLGPIPEGWEVKTVAQLCSRIQAGGTPRRSESAFWVDGTVDWYKTGDLNDSLLVASSERISEYAVTSSAARTFDPQTILMAIYGSPTVGRLGLLETASSANQAALGLVADPHVTSTVHLWFTLRDLRDHLNLIAQGAAQQNVSKKKVAESRVATPPASLVSQFTEIADPPWRLSHRLVRVNAHLAALKNLVLPRLVTGDINMSQLDFDALVRVS